MTRPLRSARITRPRRYYETVRPCAPHRYSAPHSYRCLGVSLTQPIHRPAHRGDRFPRSAPEPEPRSRHLHAGHHPGSKQVTPGLIPEQLPDPGFDVNKAVTTRHQWFASARLHGSHLTRSTARLFRNAHHPGSLPTQLAVVYGLPLQGDRGGPTPISDAAPLKRSLRLHRSPPSRSWHTEVTREHPAGLRPQERRPARPAATGRWPQPVAAQDPAH
jgi:hypothetical protein